MRRIRDWLRQSDAQDPAAAMQQRHDDLTRDRDQRGDGRGGDDEDRQRGREQSYLCRQGHGTGSKDRTIAGTIRRLFRDVAKAITRALDAPQPKIRRRRSGEDARDPFPAVARKMARRAATQTQPHVAASICLSETLDWLHLWHNDAAASGYPGGAFDMKSNHLSPHL